MGDAENNSLHSKKRAAGVQLSRDNPGLDDYEGTCQNEEGTFKRASDEVLAARRIVKVRRHQTTSTPSAPDPAPVPSNPFAAIRLVPPASSATPVEKVEESNVTSTETEEIVKNDTNKVRNVRSTETEEIVKNYSNNENESSEPKVDSNLEVEKPDLSVANDVQQSEVAKSENSEDGLNNAAENHNSVNELKKDAEGANNDEEKENSEATTEKNLKTASFSSFQTLSSSQNAFSGFAGTGFSSTTYSFGSTSNGGAPSGSTTGSFFGLKNDHSSFGFGVTNNGNSPIFGTLGANAVDQSENSKPSSMPEVPVETGEENEMAVFTGSSVLFEFVDCAWKERGKGELKVNVSVTGTGKPRVVMRTRGNYRLILNANLFPDMKLTDMDKKGITFACVNSAGEGKDSLSTIALKFKDASVAEDFRAAVTFYKDDTNVPLKTPENSP